MKLRTCLPFAILLCASSVRANPIEISATFEGLEAQRFSFGPPTPFPLDVTFSALNGTGIDWSDFHLQVVPDGELEFSDATSVFTTQSFTVLRTIPAGGTIAFPTDISFTGFRLLSPNNVNIELVAQPSVTGIPEPSTLFLLACGCAGLGWGCVGLRWTRRISSGRKSPLACLGVMLLTMTPISGRPCAGSDIQGTHTDQTWLFTNPPPPPIPDPGGGRPRPAPIPPDISENPAGTAMLEPIGSFGWAGMAEGRQGVLGFTIGDLLITVPNIEADMPKQLIIDVIYLTSDASTRLPTPAVNDALSGAWQPLPAETDDSPDPGPPATTPGYQWRNFHAHFATTICPDSETVRITTPDMVLAYDAIRVVTDCTVPELPTSILFGLAGSAALLRFGRRQE
jgi:hypothetical protein